jgi:hypothetical protein
MAGPPNPAERPARVEFTRSTQDQVPGFIGLMGILHAEPMASAFSRLLRKELRGDDYVRLAHFFEEVSVLTLHRHVAEDLLFDAFALDMYWDELREDVMGVRAQTGNQKFCENFEIAADRARRYRKDFPPKLRWQRRDRPDDQAPPGGRWPRADDPQPSRPSPSTAPVST